MYQKNRSHPTVSLRIDSCHQDLARIPLSMAPYSAVTQLGRGLTPICFSLLFGSGHRHQRMRYTTATTTSIIGPDTLYPSRSAFVIGVSTALFVRNLIGALHILYGINLMNYPI